MQLENLSIITEFGCPYSCSFCISKSQNTKNEYEFDGSFLRDLRDIVLEGDVKRLSISGGGDPLFAHNNDTLKFYEAVVKFAEFHELPLSVHTNWNYPNIVAETYSFDKFVVSINHSDYKEKIKNWKHIKNVRYAYVSDGNLRDYYDILSGIVDEYWVFGKRVEFTVRQLDGSDISDYSSIISDIADLEDDSIRFLPSGDYNLYYNLNKKKTFKVFKDMLD